MNKTELIAQVAEKTGLSKKDSELAVNKEGCRKGSFFNNRHNHQYSS